MVERACDTETWRRVSLALRDAVSQAFRRDGIAPATGDAELDLLGWGKRFLPNHFAKPPSELHRWLSGQAARMRVRRGLKVNAIGPRGSAKSTVATLAAVLRAALEGDEPYIWIVSDTKAQAHAHLENVKSELLDNAALARQYPRSVGRGAVWRAGGVSLRNGVVIEAYGVGQRLRGKRRRETRPTLIVCDDLQNDRHIVSASQREASADWFFGTLMKAGTKETNCLNLATALHRDALALRLTRTPGWTSRTFQSVVAWPSNEPLWQQWEQLYCDREDPAAVDTARAFYDRHFDEMNAGACVLWPAEEDLYTLMRLRLEDGATAFDREKQSSPLDPSRCEWPESYFGDDIWFDEWPSRLTLKTIALDPSKGADARHGDYSAFVLLGVDDRGLLYIDADLARRPTSQMVADGVDHCLRFRPDAFGVEANQWQHLLSGEFLAEFQRQGGLGITPCELNNHVSKALRVRRLGPYLSQRRLRFKRNSESVALLVDQLRDFPLGAHDDGPDALEMALRLAEDAWRTRDETVD